MRAPGKLHGYAPPRNARLPREIYDQPGVAVLLTIRAYQGRPFEDQPRLCEAVVQFLVAMRLEYGCWVGAYCLMPDHLHLIAGPAEEGCSVLTFIERFKGKSTNESWRCGWQGRLWQRRSHDHVIRRAEALEETSAYVLNNPVRAGLVDPEQTWPWCGIADHFEW